MASGGKGRRDDLEITAIGALYTGPLEKKYWSSSRGKEKYPYPVGYEATRCHGGHNYLMKVSEGPRGPLFAVTCEEGIACSGQTPSAPWEDILKKRHAGAKKIIMRSSSSTIDGPEMFGFTHPLVQRLCRDLVVSASGLAQRSDGDGGSRGKGVSQDDHAVAGSGSQVAESSRKSPRKPRKSKKLSTAMQESSSAEYRSDTEDAPPPPPPPKAVKPSGGRGKRKPESQETGTQKLKRVPKRSEGKLKGLEGIVDSMPVTTTKRKTKRNSSMEAGNSSSEDADVAPRNNATRAKRSRSFRSKALDAVDVGPSRGGAKTTTTTAKKAASGGPENSSGAPSHSMSTRKRPLKGNENVVAEQLAKEVHPVASMETAKAIAVDVVEITASSGSREMQGGGAGGGEAAEGEEGGSEKNQNRKSPPLPQSKDAPPDSAVAAVAAAVDEALPKNATSKKKRLKLANPEAALPSPQPPLLANTETVPPVTVIHDEPATSSTPSPLLLAKEEKKPSGPPPAATAAAEVISPPPSLIVDDSLEKFPSLDLEKKVSDSQELDKYNTKVDLTQSDGVLSIDLMCPSADEIGSSKADESGKVASGPKDGVSLLLEACDLAVEKDRPDLNTSLKEGGGNEEVKEKQQSSFEVDSTVEKGPPNEAFHGASKSLEVGGDEGKEVGLPPTALGEEPGGNENVTKELEKEGDVILIATPPPVPLAVGDVGAKAGQGFPEASVPAKGPLGEVEQRTGGAFPVDKGGVSSFLDTTAVTGESPNGTEVGGEGPRRQAETSSTSSVIEDTSSGHEAAKSESIYDLPPSSAAKGNQIQQSSVIPSAPPPGDGIVAGTEVKSGSGSALKEHPEPRTGFTNPTAVSPSISPVSLSSTSTEGIVQTNHVSTSLTSAMESVPPNVGSKLPEPSFVGGLAEVDEAKAIADQTSMAEVVVSSSIPVMQSVAVAAVSGDIGPGKINAAVEAPPSLSLPVGGVVDPDTSVKVEPIPEGTDDGGAKVMINKAEGAPGDVTAVSIPEEILATEENSAPAVLENRNQPASEVDQVGKCEEPGMGKDLNASPHLSSPTRTGGSDTEFNDGARSAPLPAPVGVEKNEPDFAVSFGKITEHGFVTMLSPSSHQVDLLTDTVPNEDAEMAVLPPQNVHQTSTHAAENQPVPVKVDNEQNTVEVSGHVMENGVITVLPPSYPVDLLGDILPEMAFDGASQAVVPPPVIDSKSTSKVDSSDGVVAEANAAGTGISSLEENVQDLTDEERSALLAAVKESEPGIELSAGKINEHGVTTVIYDTTPHGVKPMMMDTIPEEEGSATMTQEALWNDVDDSTERSVEQIRDLMPGPNGEDVGEGLDTKLSTPLSIDVDASATIGGGEAEQGVSDLGDLSTGEAVMKHPQLSVSVANEESSAGTVHLSKGSRPGDDHQGGWVSNDDRQGDGLVTGIEPEHSNISGKDATTASSNPAAEVEQAVVEEGVQNFLSEEGQNSGFDEEQRSKLSSTVSPSSNGHRGQPENCAKNGEDRSSEAGAATLEASYFDPADQASSYLVVKEASDNGEDNSLVSTHRDVVNTDLDDLNLVRDTVTKAVAESEDVLDKAFRSTGAAIIVEDRNSLKEAGPSSTDVNGQEDLASRASLGLEEYADFMKAGLESLGTLENGLDLDDKDGFQDTSISNIEEKARSLEKTIDDLANEVQPSVSQVLSETGESESASGQLTKSMLTLLLPQAVPLLPKKGGKEKQHASFDEQRNEVEKQTLLSEALSTVANRVERDKLSDSNAPVKDDSLSFDTVHQFPRDGLRNFDSKVNSLIQGVMSKAAQMVSNGQKASVHSEPAADDGEVQPNDQETYSAFVGKDPADGGLGDSDQLQVDDSDEFLLIPNSVQAFHHEAVRVDSSGRVVSEMSEKASFSVVETIPSYARSAAEETAVPALNSEVTSMVSRFEQSNGQPLADGPALSSFQSTPGKEVLEVRDLKNRYAHHQKEVVTVVPAESTVLDYEGLPSTVKHLDDSKEMESVFCIEQNYPVSAIVVNVQGDEVRLCVACDLGNGKERSCSVYQASLGVDVELKMICTSTFTCERAVCGASNGLQIPIEDSAMRFSPDGQQLLLLDCFKLPDSCYSTISNHNHDGRGVNIVAFENEKFRITEHLQGDDVLRCLTVPGPQLLIGAGDNGCVNCWEFDSFLRTCKNKFSLPRAAREGSPFTSVTRLSVMPGSPHLVLGCGHGGSVALWDTRNRTLLSSCQLPNHKILRAMWLDIPAVSLDHSGILGVDIRKSDWHDSLPDTLKCLLTMVSRRQTSTTAEAEGETTNEYLHDTSQAEADWRCLTIVLKRNGVSYGPVLPGRASAVTAVGPYGVMGTAEGLVQLWDVANGQKISEFYELEGSPIVNLATNPSSAVLVAANANGRVVIYVEKDGSLR